MSLFISHQSALEYWRIHRKLPAAKRRRSLSLPSDPPTKESLKHSSLSDLTEPLHIMLGNQRLRRSSLEVKQHILQGTQPAGSFLKIEDGLMVSSPELCFLQLAGQLPLSKLVLLGYEFCGTYSIPISGDPATPGCGFFERTALTSSKELRAFIDSMSGVKGHQKATRALRFVLDGAASPMEAKLAILLTFPNTLGGYNLILPQLNHRVVPVKTEKLTASKSFYVCDLFWPEYKLAVEYDSDFYHANSKKIASDAKKRLALTSMNITVLTATKDQVYSTTDLEKVAKAIAKHLGKRLWHMNKPDFAVIHNDLRKQLNFIKSEFIP